MCFRCPVTPTGGAFKLSLTGQGCADKGLCYPPQTQVAELDLSDPNAARIKLIGADGEASVAPPLAGGELQLDAALQSGRFWTVVGMFFIAGLLLSLTPCVLPMLPILSSIIVGRSGASTSRGRSFLLAVSYSLGMALIYTALGVEPAWPARGLPPPAKPWVLSLFALA